MLGVSLEVAPGVLYQFTKATLVTRIFQKALNGYLYIPGATLTHPKGLVCVPPD